MRIEKELLPDPVTLINSMRSVGYSPESAIADLIDNSISAKATLIHVRYNAVEDFVSILDNGCGMSADELENAMRHGSHPSSKERSKDDLGRFGLGLKTASLSQCRKFTVVSRKEGNLVALCWDLDVVKKRRRWVVVVPSKAELKRLPEIESLNSLETGTLVVWQDLDRLYSGSKNKIEEISARFNPLVDHLSLVFHRFRTAEGNNPAVKIMVNGRPLEARDPFLERENGTQPLEGQKIQSDEMGAVTVAPFVLPPINRLTTEQIKLAGGLDGLRGSQGFYVYRARRLVVWGTWFRMFPKNELYKLTRVRVDIPNSFDELWSLDIKKSSAYPPEYIRRRLVELVPHFIDASKKTVAYTGRAHGQKNFVALWRIVEASHGVFKYEPNDTHPLIADLLQELSVDVRKSLECLLAGLGAALPLQTIYAHMSRDDQSLKRKAQIEELANFVTKYTEAFGQAPENAFQFDPLVAHLDLKQEIMEYLKNGHGD